MSFITEQAKGIPYLSPGTWIGLILVERRPTQRTNMKKFFALLTCVAIAGVLNAQTTATEKSEPAKQEKVKECAKGDAHKAGCCADKAKASADAKHAEEAGADAAKPAGCCAGKSSASSCHGAKAEGHGKAHEHAHASAKEHVCTDACKDGAHAYACGEAGHTCSEACHAHAH